MKFTIVNESLSVYKPNVLYGELFNYFNKINVNDSVTPKGIAPCPVPVHRQEALI